MKSEIIEELGQFDLLLPSLIAEGLAANDRVKARLSVLQAAAQHAHEPLAARFDLAGECRAAGMDGFLVKPLDRERLAAALAGADDAALAA